MGPGIELKGGSELRVPIGMSSGKLSVKEINLRGIHSIQCVSSLDPNDGGPPRSVTGLASALSAHASTSLLAPVSSGKDSIPIPEGVKWLNPEVVESRKASRESSLAALIRGALDSELPTILHTHGVWLPFEHTISKIGAQLKVKHVVSPRGMLEPWSLAHKKWKKRIAWWLYQRADLLKATAFHATAEAEAENLRRLGLKQPIAVIPNGIDLPDLPFSGARIPKVPGGPKSALFISRLHPKKGLETLIEVWAKLKPEDWQLLIAGNGERQYENELLQQIAGRGMEHRIRILGPVFGEEKTARFRDADLFVLPSFSENFGIVVAEALSFGVPVLTTKGCPWQELETHNCGWWVEPTLAGVEAGLCAALEAGSEELRAMGLRGRALVEERYQWPGIAERMLAFYEWILNGGERPEFVV